MINKKVILVATLLIFAAPLSSFAFGGDGKLSGDSSSYGGGKGGQGGAK